MENQSHPDFKKNKINRKQFLRLAGLALLIPLFRIWQVTVDKKRGEAKSQIREIVIQPDLHDGVHFFENVILIKKNEEIDLLSSKCTHLGCQINKTENNRLICPCHGSEYNFEGQSLKGPAINPLTKIDFEKVVNNQEIRLRFMI